MAIDGLRWCNSFVDSSITTHTLPINLYTKEFASTASLDDYADTGASYITETGFVFEGVIASLVHMRNHVAQLRLKVFSNFINLAHVFFVAFRSGANRTRSLCDVGTYHIIYCICIRQTPRC